MGFVNLAMGRPHIDRYTEVNRGASMELEHRTMPDGSVEVCCNDDGVRLCGFVSSMHLVEPKYNQLHKLLTGQLTTDRSDGWTHDDVEGAA